MQRLREQRHSDDPTTSLAARLLSSRPPRRTSQLALDRVWLALEVSRRRAPRPWLLKPAVAVLVVLGLLTCASAMYGRAVLSRILPLFQATAPRASDRPVATLPPPLVAPPIRLVAPLVTIPPVAAPPAIAVRAPSPPTRPQLPAEPSATAPPVVDSEASLFNDGFLALRRAQDPARATLLFNEYLTRYPTGPLAEEALAFSIEAASISHDGNARALAADYLRRFPHGRFRDTVERAHLSASH